MPSPWYFYVDEAFHRLLARWAYGTGWRFCDWVERRYQGGPEPPTIHNELTPQTSNSTSAAVTCCCSKCR